MRYENGKVKVTSKVKYTPVFKGCVGQDGAVFGDMLFRFEADGSCSVYSIAKQEIISSFVLDKVDVLRPHSNAVTFGAARFDAEDEFPLLYTNIYNNHAREADRLEGTLCAYRLQRSGTEFSAKLVQVIRIGFTEDLMLWKSLPENGDVRSYGNLTVDPIRNRLYAFVMRDKEHVTRYFEFNAPLADAGEYSEAYGCNVVTLAQDDILGMFDAPYSNYLQGACAYDGLVFSVEGFNVKTAEDRNRPRMQIVDMDARNQAADIDLFEAGLCIEPEFVDYEGDTLYYMDASGALYIFDFT